MYVKFKDDNFQITYENPDKELLNKFYETVFNIALSNIHKYIEIPEKSRKKVDKQMKMALEKTLKYLNDIQLPDTNSSDTNIYIFLLNLPEKKTVKKVTKTASDPEKAYFYAFVADIVGNLLNKKSFWITREHLAKKYPQLKVRGMGRFKKYGK